LHLVGLVMIHVLSPFRSTSLSCGV
jgi:hypothetical protein